MGLLGLQACEQPRVSTDLEATTGTLEIAADEVSYGSQRPARGRPAFPQGNQEAPRPGKDREHKKENQRRARASLQRWEEESDSGHEDGARAGRDPEMNPFLDQDESDAALVADSRVKEAAMLPMERTRSMSIGEEQPRSWEERVLGMKPVNRVQPSQTQGEKDSEVRDARRAAYKDGLVCYDLLVSTKWHCSKGAIWHPGDDLGTLSGQPGARGSLIATYLDVKVPDFDVEAELSLSEGSRAGLVFRAGGRGEYSVLSVNVDEQQAEYYGPSGCMPLGHAKLSQDRYHTLRVRAVEDSMSFFVDNRQVGQRTTFGIGDHVICHGTDTAEECTVLDVNQKKRGVEYTLKPVKSDEGEEEKGERKADALCVAAVPGFFGVWAPGGSKVKIRGGTVTNLKEFIEQVRFHENLLSDAKAAQLAQEDAFKASFRKRLRAVQVLQEICKFRVNFIKQRKNMFQTAEKMGQTESLRQRKLLTWFALLSFFARFNEVLATPDMMKKRDDMYTAYLDREHPPPPPPPLKDPPTPEAEELHYRYEAGRLKYKEKWEEEGKRVVGAESFEMIRNSVENGPAEREKKLIAQKCYDKSMEVLSEQEHREFLQKAYTLESDWASSEDTREDFEKWSADKRRVGYSSQHKQHRPRVGLPT